MPLMIPGDAAQIISDPQFLLAAPQHFPAHFCLFSSLPLFIFIPAKRFYALPLQALPGALSVPAGVSGTLTTGDI